MIGGYRLHLRADKRNLRRTVRHSVASAGADARFHALLARARVLTKELRGLVVIILIGDAADAMGEVADAAAAHAHRGALGGIHRAPLGVTDEPHDVIVVTTREQG